VTDNPRINVRKNAVVRSIEGADRPQRVVIEDVKSGARESIPAAGVFVRLGMTPNSELIEGST
jgi:thioredoxin reductase (NADPH)